MRMEVREFNVVIIVWAVGRFMNTQKDAYEGQRVRGCHSLSYTHHMLSSWCLSASLSPSVRRYCITLKEMYLKWASLWGVQEWFKPQMEIFYSDVIIKFVNNRPKAIKKLGEWTGKQDETNFHTIIFFLKLTIKLA